MGPGSETWSGWPKGQEGPAGLQERRRGLEKGRGISTHALEWHSLCRSSHAEGLTWQSPHVGQGHTHSGAAPEALWGCSPNSPYRPSGPAPPPLGTQSVSARSHTLR